MKRILLGLLLIFGLCFGALLSCSESESSQQQGDDDDDDNDDTNNGDDDDDVGDDDDDVGDDDDDNDDNDDDDDLPDEDPEADLSKTATVDDLEDGDDIIAEYGGRIGSWYTFGDDEGTMTPSGIFKSGECGPGGSSYCAKVEGSGFTEWGAGIGFDLQNPGHRECDGFPSTEAPHPYDASKYDGVSFKARGAGHKLRFTILTDELRVEDEGGDCEGDDCWSRHGRDITLNDEWTTYTYMFDKLKQQWGGSVPFDKGAICKIMFQTAAKVDFDYEIDDIVFFGATDDEEAIGDGTQNGIEDIEMAVGFRNSSYGNENGDQIDFDDVDAWLSVGNQMVDKFGGDSVPTSLWIIGETAFGSDNEDENGTCIFNFPGRYDEYDHVEFADCDLNEAALDKFDEAGFKIWLQVEPGIADMHELIDIVLSRYSHHECVIGFGVDVEFHGITVEHTSADPVDNAQAQDWLEHIREYNPNYSLVLKHWDAAYLPSGGEGLVFVNDGNGLGSMEAMQTQFENWGITYQNDMVGYQVGYPTDESWWSVMGDPVQEMGNNLMDGIPNMNTYLWVDFTIANVITP